MSWQLGAVLSRQLGGVPAMLGPLTGEMPGAGKTQLEYPDDGLDPATAARLPAFGIDRGRDGQSGFPAPFSRAG